MYRYCKDEFIFILCLVSYMDDNKSLTFLFQKERIHLQNYVWSKCHLFILEKKQTNEFVAVCNIVMLTIELCKSISWIIFNNFNIHYTLIVFKRRATTGVVTSECSSIIIFKLNKIEKMRRVIYQLIWNSFKACYY